ncbi:hypothetical protein FQN54_000188 [Arachnomyces sp. PD_36]|nr:hypothetical protein FQN54_000188 [Arachnomyces sp. PD_36]
MTDNIHSVKRRRLDAAASTLSKPFKSPLRARIEKTDDAEAQQPTAGYITKETSKPDITDDKENIQTQPQTPPKPATTRPTPYSSAVSKPFTHQSPTLTPSKASTPVFKQTRTSPLSSSSSSDPHLSSLISQHSSLLTRLSSLRTELDTTRQALKIEESGRDAELEELITKWKAAGRMAAEELYSGARERVNRMGGVGVWRERVEEGNRRRQEWDRGGFDGEEKNPEGGENGEEDGEREREDEEGDGGKDEEDVILFRSFDLPALLDSREFVPSWWRCANMDRGQSFTMDMMLKSLNIELGVIGFDKVNQRWVD